MGRGLPQPGGSGGMRHRFHSICPYFAMFPETFVEKHLAASPHDGIVFDPYCGRGTTVFQALLQGRAAAGSDLNPVAVCISGAKGDPPSLSDARARLEELRRECREPNDEGWQGDLDRFFTLCFQRDTLLQVRYLRGAGWPGHRRDHLAPVPRYDEQSGDTRLPTRFGSLVLEVRDGDGGPAVPARVGLYDATGRARTGDRKGGEHLQAVVARDALTVVRSRRQDCLPESDEDDPLLRRAGAPQAPVHRSRVVRRSNRGAGLARDAAGRPHPFLGRDRDQRRDQPARSTGGDAGGR